MQPQGLRRWLTLSAALLVLGAGLFYTPLGGWLARGFDSLQEGLAQLPARIWARGAGTGSAAVRDLLAKGMALQKEQRPQEALDCYRLALQQDANYPPTHAALGNVYLQLGRGDDALRELERAAALAPKDGGILFQLGQVYLQRNDFERSIATLERAKQAAPEDAQTRTLLGTAYYYRGRADIQDAVRELEQGAVLDPQDADLQFRLALAYLQRDDAEDDERARQALQQALALDPGQSEAYRYLGLVYLRAGQQDAAVEAWRRYVEVGADAQTVERVRDWLRSLQAGGGVP